MKTVGEFLNAGLEFVKDDKCYKNGSSGDEFHRHWHEAPRMYSDQVVSKFAWRENTGVKPEFMGLIDVKFSTGAALSGYDKNLLGWNKTGAALPIIEWRPSLNQHQKWPDNSRIDLIGQNGNDGLHYNNTAQQVEALDVNNKPIFTQAMACAGEFPLIGAKCVYVFMENGSEYTGSIAAIDGNVIWFKLDGGGYKTCFGVHKFKAVDNRTDREKAIDEMLELDLWATDREFLEAIYDAGYRKC